MKFVFSLILYLIMLFIGMPDAIYLYFIHYKKLFKYNNIKKSSLFMFLVIYPLAIVYKLSPHDIKPELRKKAHESFNSENFFTFLFLVEKS